MSIKATAKDSNFPYIELIIDTDAIVLRSPKDDKYIPLWHEIESLIRNQIPWYAKFAKPFVWLLLAFAAFILPENIKVPESAAIWVVWVFLAAGFILLAFSLASFIYLRVSCGIHLIKRHEVKTFWQRYGEKITFLILGTLLGVVGKIVSDKLVGH